MSPVLEQFPADVVGGEKLKVFSTTRQGGVSEGNYASFNINCYCGDRPETVRKQWPSTDGCWQKSWVSK